MLKPGDRAPEVNLEDQDGRPFLLSSYRGKSPVVLFFYPKDDTPVCTKEACMFRDQHTEFTGLDAVVAGISDDGRASHKRFAEEHHLPYALLSDADGAVRAAFGLRALLGFKPRATFVIDSEGIIRAVVVDRLNAGKHVRMALAALGDQRLTKS